MLRSEVTAVNPDLCVPPPLQEGGGEPRGDAGSAHSIARGGPRPRSAAPAGGGGHGGMWGVNGGGRDAEGTWGEGRDVGGIRGEMVVGGTLSGCGGMRGLCADSSVTPPRCGGCVALWSGGRWGCGRGQEPPRNSPPPPNPDGGPPKTPPNTQRSALSDSAHRPFAPPTVCWPRPLPHVPAHRRIRPHCAGAAPDWWRQLLGAQAPPIPLRPRPPSFFPGPPLLFIAPLGPPLINATNGRSDPVTSDPVPQ